MRKGQSVDLDRLSTYSEKGPFDLAQQGATTHLVQYRPLLGALESRLRDGHLAPRSYTLFAPLRRVQRRIAGEISAGGYDAVLVHPDPMPYAPYPLRRTTHPPTVSSTHNPP